MANFNFNFNFKYMGDYLQYKDSQGNTLIVNGGIINETATGAVAEFTDGAENIPIKSLTVTMNPIQSGTGNPSPENVRPISGRTTVNIWREATYDTSVEPTLTIQLGQTVYGGTVDVVSGEMVVDRAMVDLGTLDWRYAQTDNGFFTFSITDIKIGLALDRTAPIICEKYGTGGIGWVHTVNYQIAVNSSSGASSRQVIVKDTNYTDATSFKTSLNGVTACYELAQPITVQLTPEQLTTLLGTNYIWTDADSVSVDYVADTKLYIQNAISDAVSTI